METLPTTASEGDDSSELHNSARIRQQVLSKFQDRSSALLQSRHDQPQSLLDNNREQQQQELPDPTEHPHAVEVLNYLHHTFSVEYPSLLDSSGDELSLVRQQVWTSIFERCFHYFTESSSTCANFVTKLESMVQPQISACGFIWAEGTVAYRCVTCQLSPCTSICASCFQAADHEGHDYCMFKSYSGGACDCGMPEVMKSNGFCSAHQTWRNDGKDPLDGIPAAHLQTMYSFLAALYKFIRTHGHSADPPIRLSKFSPILNWLTELCSSSNLLRHIISKSLVYNETGQHLVNLAAEDDFPTAFTNLFLKMLPERPFKTAFAKWFSSSYPILIHRLIHNVQHNELANKMVHVSVQLYCGPEITMYCVKNFDIIDTLVHASYRLLHSVINGDGVFNLTHHIITEHRYWCPTSDLVNILTHDQAAIFMLRSPMLMNCWLQSMSLLQGINAQKRQFLQHIVYENMSWSHAFSLEIEVAGNVMQLLCAGLKLLPAEDALAVLSLVSQSLDDCFVLDNSSSHEVSFHWPLQRVFVAFLAVVGMQTSLDLILHALPRHRPSQQYFADAIKMPLTVLASAAQIRAGMWRRNGFNMTRQSWLYSNATFYDIASSLDVGMLQIAALVMDPSVLINEIHVAFCPNSASEHAESLISSNLLLLIGLVKDTWRFSKADIMSALITDIVALLSVHDYSYSQLSDALPSRLSRSGHLSTALEQVATFQAPKQAANGTMLQGCYKLTAESWIKHFDYDLVAFRQFSVREHVGAMKRYADFMKTKYGEDADTCPPVKPLLKLADTFTPLYSSLLLSPTLHRLLCTVLLRQFSSILDDQQTIKPGTHAMPDSFDTALRLLELICQYSAPMCADNPESLFADELVECACYGGSDPSLKHAASFEELIDSRSIFFNLHVPLTHVAGLVDRQWTMIDVLARLHEVTVDSSRILTGRVLHNLKRCSTVALNLHTHAQSSQAHSQQTLEVADDDREERKRKAKLRQQKILAEFSRRQDDFISSQPDTDSQEPFHSPSSRIHLRTSSSCLSMDDPPSQTLQYTNEDDEDEAVDPVSGEELTCVICMNGLLPDVPFGLVSAILNSNAEAFRRPILKYEAANLSTNSDGQHTPTTEDPACCLAGEQTPSCRLHVRSCGHLLHVTCFQAYHSTIHRDFRGQSLHTDYLCPLCRRPANTLIPLISSAGEPLFGSDAEHAPENDDDELLDPAAETTVMLKRNMWARVKSSLHEMKQRIERLSRNAPETILQTLLQLVHTHATSVVSPMSAAPSSTSTTQSGAATLSGRTLLRAVSTLLIESSAQPMSLLTQDHRERLELGRTLSTQTLRPQLPLLLRDGSLSLFWMLLSATEDNNNVGLVRSPAGVSNLVMLQLRAVLVQAAMVVRSNMTAALCNEISATDWQVLWRSSMLSMSEDDRSEAWRLVCLQVFSDVHGLCEEHPSCNAATLPPVLLNENLTNADGVADAMQLLCSPILRCASWYMSIILPNWSSLTGISPVVAGSLNDNMEALTRLLRVDVGPVPAWASLRRRWVEEFLSGVQILSRPAFPLAAYDVPRLYSLPDHFSELHRQCLSTICLNCHAVPTRPAICLACGTLVCMKQACCSRAHLGELTQHFISCGSGGLGLFLEIEATTVLVIGKIDHFRFSFVWGSPYLDKHGEEDVSIARGKPLFLNKERYALLEKQWKENILLDRTAHRSLHDDAL